MIVYLLKRIGLAVITLIAVSLATFIVIRAPAGDYVDYLHEYCPHIQCPYAVETPEEMEIIRDQLGLNKPLLVQYWNWITPIIFELDFGMSNRVSGVWEPAIGILREALMPTIYLTLFTIIITWTLAIPIGIYSAVRQHSIGDYVFTFLGFTGLAVPDFLLALVVMYVLYAYFEMSVGALYSAAYAFEPWSFGKVMDMFQHLIVPALVLGTAGTAALIRIMRNNLLDELTRPYVVTAMAKGMSHWKVILKYPLRVAINPFISSIGFILPSLISGSIILSVVMGLPTIGLVLLGAIENEDIYLAGDIILILGFLTIVGTLVSDILLMIVDPRIKLAG